MRLIKDTYILFSVTAIAALVSFITGIWIRNILGPEEYGIWLVFSLILTYGYRMHLGILDGFNRDFPIMLGQRNYKKANKVRNAVFTWMIGSSVLAFAAIVVVLILPLSTFETVLSIITILLIPLQNLALFYNTIFLTIQQFNTVAIIQLIIGSLQYVLMGVFALMFGIYGLLIGVLAGNSLAIFFGHSKLRIKLKIDWNWEILRGMFLYGIPITLIGILFNLLITLDRLIIFYFFGSAAVGHYGITAFVYQGIMVLPGVFHQVMYPKISYKYGAFGKKKALKNIVFEPAILLSYLSPIILGTLYFIFPAFIYHVLPQYTDGIDSAKFMIIGMFSLIWVTLYGHYLTVVNKQWTYFNILLFSVFLNAILNVSFVKFGLDIEGVALGTAITYFIYPIIMMWFCCKDMGDRTIDFLKQAALAINPFIVMVLLIIAAEFLKFHYIINFLFFIGSYLLFIIICSSRISILIAYRKKMIEIIKSRINTRSLK
ncbi:oligosaccharide flippase family protein [Metabacillus idriensis]|uniref:oligosaccharide flippase family protein n=1 Tax=Metabacillus idriensis TaxID=324768 RepID=UPI003D2DAF8F